MSRWDRLLIFGACNLAALACFVLCFALFPILWPVPRKFAILLVYPDLFFFSRLQHPQYFQRATRHFRHYPIRTLCDLVPGARGETRDQAASCPICFDCLLLVSHILHMPPIYTSNTRSWLALTSFTDGPLGPYYFWPRGQSSWAQ